MLGRSDSPRFTANPPWEEVFSTPFEKMERVAVAGGWVYRSWVIFGSDSRDPGLSMIFVPGPAPGPAIAPVNVDVPAVVGTGEVGQTLTCTTGNWDNEPTSYSYAWTSRHLSTLEEASIGTNTNTYVITDSDTGKSIFCTVTATNSAGSTTAPPSNSIDVP